MTNGEEVFIISVPAAQAERVSQLLPTGFKPAKADAAPPEFRFGVSELYEFIGVARDMAELVVAVLSIVAALRAAGGGKVGVRAATAAEPVEIDANMDDDTIRAKLTRGQGR